MYVETYIISALAWLIITRTSLNMSKFLRVVFAGWFVIMVAVHVFSYTQNHDWRNLVHAFIWSVAAIQTVLTKPIDKRGFWRDLRETAWPMFDALVLLILVFSLTNAWSWSNTLQMTQPAIEAVMVAAEGARGEEEVKDRISPFCPDGFYIDTVWSGKLYVECPRVIDWGERTQLNFSVKPDPKSEAVAVAAVGFFNETGELWFVDRGPWD